MAISGKFASYPGKYDRVRHFDESFYFFTDSSPPTCFEVSSLKPWDGWRAYLRPDTQVLETQAAFAYSACQGSKCLVAINFSARPEDAKDLPAPAVWLVFEIDLSMLELCACKLSTPAEETFRVDDAKDLQMVASSMRPLQSLQLRFSTQWQDESPRFQWQQMVLSWSCSQRKGASDLSMRSPSSSPTEVDLMVRAMTGRQPAFPASIGSYQVQAAFASNERVLAAATQTFAVACTFQKNPAILLVVKAKGAVAPSSSGDDWRGEVCLAGHLCLEWKQVDASHVFVLRDIQKHPAAAAVPAFEVEVDGQEGAAKEWKALTALGKSFWGDIWAMEAGKADQRHQRPWRVLPLRQAGAIEICEDDDEVGEVSLTQLLEVHLLRMVQSSSCELKYELMHGQVLAAQRKERQQLSRVTQLDDTAKKSIHLEAQENLRKILQAKNSEVQNNHQEKSDRQQDPRQEERSRRQQSKQEEHVRHYHGQRRSKEVAARSQENKEAAAPGKRKDTLPQPPQTSGSRSFSAWTPEPTSSHHTRRRSGGFVYTPDEVLGSSGAEQPRDDGSLDHGPLVATHLYGISEDYYWPLVSLRILLESGGTVHEDFSTEQHAAAVSQVLLAIPSLHEDPSLHAFIEETLSSCGYSSLEQGGLSTSLLQGFTHDDVRYVFASFTPAPIWGLYAGQYTRLKLVDVDLMASFFWYCQCLRRVDPTTMKTCLQNLPQSYVNMHPKDRLGFPICFVPWVDLQRCSWDEHISSRLFFAFQTNLKNEILEWVQANASGNPAWWTAPMLRSCKWLIASSIHSNLHVPSLERLLLLLSSVSIAYRKEVVSLVEKFQREHGSEAKFRENLLSLLDGSVYRFPHMTPPVSEQWYTNPVPSI